MPRHPLVPVAALTAALVSPLPAIAHGNQSPGFRLTGDGVALIMGGSGVPTPSQQYAETANSLYLQPHGFGGTPEVLTTPELFTNRVLSETQGADNLTQAIQQNIADGDAGPDNPVYVFGYSQSSALSALAMQQLDAANVPSDAVHFVLVGNPSAPNGGMFTTFGLTGGDYPDDMPPADLYPTDVYTMEYDGVADWPRYSLNLLSDVNALYGLYFGHLAYLGLTAEQIAGAIPLETAADSLVDYHMIQAEYLPILIPLLLTPIIGKPLYDLLEPDMRILVNLGYGSITDGWNSGPADVAATVDWGSPDLDPNEVSAALSQGAQDGFAAFMADLADPATYQIQNPVDSPALAELVSAAYGAGIIDTPHPASIQTVLDGWASLFDPATWLTF